MRLAARKMCAGLSALLASVAVDVARADERILSYHSDITVRADSELEVRETIRVRAEGVSIKRGIYRDFPTFYERDGKRVITGFELVSVLRDGHYEPNHTATFRENGQIGVRIYAGSEDVMLAPGEYTYEFSYRTDRQIGFFADYDELYWNVTGNGWAFPIDRVTADVHLPSGVSERQIHVEGYTGPFGARGTDYSARVAGDTPYFETTRMLGAGEGFTLVVTWPKGFVTAPTETMRASYLLRDSWPAIAAWAGFPLLMLYYLWTWSAVGRDPAGRIVVPHYEPPTGQSPASMRYVLRMKYDDRCFAAGVLGLAVKGYLTIEQRNAGLLGLKREFVLNKMATPKDAPALSADESALYQRLFMGGSRLELVNENHETVSGARSAHRSSLKQKLSPSFFRINGGWHALGMFISVLVCVAAFLAPLWRDFSIEWFLFTVPGQVTILALLLGLLSNGVFGRLLKAPTVAGRDVMDRIEGFKLYLDVAEGDELRLQGAPALTPRLFETHLPAALALGVEQHWAERFATVFATQAVNQTAPSWYHGDRWDSRDLRGFSAGLGSSLDSAISHAATAPGSSSGSGGGGSSGGGGGGGGGGGW
jgi:uncharacterized membrane protein YgcG